MTLRCQAAVYSFLFQGKKKLNIFLIASLVKNTMMISDQNSVSASFGDASEAKLPGYPGRAHGTKNKIRIPWQITLLSAHSKSLPTTSNNVT